jgi:gas vesicle protein
MASNTHLAKGLLFGFISGAIIGGIAALLTAPKSGKELRGDLRQKSSELAGDVETYLRDAQEKAKTLINEGKERSSRLISDAKRRAASLLEDAESVLSSARSKSAGDGGHAA